MSKIIKPLGVLLYINSGFLISNAESNRASLFANPCLKKKVFTEVLGSKSPQNDRNYIN